MDRGCHRVDPTADPGGSRLSSIAVLLRSVASGLNRGVDDVEEVVCCGRRPDGHHGNRRCRRCRGSPARHDFAFTRRRFMHRRFPGHLPGLLSVGQDWSNSRFEALCRPCRAGHRSQLGDPVVWPWRRCRDPPIAVRSRRAAGRRVRRRRRSRHRQTAGTYQGTATPVQASRSTSRDSAGPAAGSLPTAGALAPQVVLSCDPDDMVGCLTFVVIVPEPETTTTTTTTLADHHARCDHHGRCRSATGADDHCGCHQPRASRHRAEPERQRRGHRRRAPRCRWRLDRRLPLARRTHAELTTRQVA